MIDSSSLIFRAFYSTPETVVAPDKTPINAAYGFINMLAQLVANYDPDFLACATDEDWRPQWRVDLLPSYKAARVDFPVDLTRQMAVIHELLQCAGVAVVGAAGYEAEDVIGTLASRADGKVLIVSGDRDLFQLVRDPEIAVIYPKRGVSDVVYVDEAEITRRFGIPGRSYGDYAMLRGDASDGLPGVPGIGEKSASALISRYGSIGGVIEAAITGDGAGMLGKIRAALDYLDRAAKVVLIDDSAPVGDVAIDRPRHPDEDLVMKVAKQHGLNSPARRLMDALSRAA